MDHHHTTDNNYSNNTTYDYTNNRPTSSSSSSSSPFANSLPPPPPSSSSQLQPPSSSSSSQSPFSFNAFESSGGGAQPSTATPFGGYPVPPQTSSGRPTTSTGLLGRPTTANPNPFRQQVYQEQYGFNADSTSSSYGASSDNGIGAEYGSSSAASPSPMSYASAPALPPPPSSGRRRGVSRRGLGSAAGGAPPYQQHPQHQQYGIQEEEDEYYIDEEEEEESEDEGLFAYLPPSTAEQEMDRQREQVQQQQQMLLQQQQQQQLHQQLLHQQQQPQPDPATTTYPYQQRPPYEPPQSPPSTESNSGSRMGTGAGEFRMTRLDGAAAHRRSGEGDGVVQQTEAPGSPLARKSSERDAEKRKSGGGVASPRSSNDHARAGQRPSVDREKEVDLTDVDLEEDKEKMQSSSALPSPTLVSAPNASATNPPPPPKAEPDTQFGKHWQHFQPNPSRSNANSGPYKRHREYHYNLAYPQYAQAQGHSTGVNVNPGTANSSIGAPPHPPSTGGSGYGAVGAAWGYGGDYADMEERRRKREEEREKIRRKRERRSKRKGRGDTAGTNVTSTTAALTTTTTTGEDGARLGTGVSEGYGAGSEYTTQSRSGKRREDEEDDLSFDLDKKSGMFYEGESRELEYEDDEEYEDGDGDSREGSIKMEFDFDAIEDEDSPYPEVRASVSNIDDPDMPAMTIRMWVVGLLLCMTSSAFNVFFNFRSPAPSIVPLVLLLLSYPVGKFLAFTLPITTYRIPLPYIPTRWVPSSAPRSVMRVLRPLTFPHAIEFSLNPGPWNIKEHVLVYIMANVAVGNPYALNAIVVLEVYYEFKTGYWFSLVLVLATQLTGFGLAGMCRRFLVWPASMVWPQNLVACTLLNTLHAEDEDDGIGMLGGPTMINADGTAEDGGVRRKRGMSRYRFFVLTMAGSFVFFFLPGYLFEALSFFSWVCWAAPNNIKVNQLFGVRNGLGMSILTFDWSQITWIGSPLMVPWWAEVHIFAGFVLFYWIMTPILYYTNSWKLAHFPISANVPYDRFGNAYNVGLVVKPDGTFDEEAYNNYSPLFLPATYAVTYLLAFCLSTCVIVHTVLYHGQTLLNGFKKMRVENDDIHAKLMRNYPEVPDWWYACAFCVFFALAIVAVEVWDTSVPVWALLLSVALPVIYILPSGFIYAMTGQGINLNILAQIIPGTLLPGQPLANMVFKAYSVQTLSEATSFVQDLKLGHYVKVPPRATFLVQLVATTMAGFIQVGVKQWIFDNVEDICQPGQRAQLTCPHNQVFYTASAVWGLIGPTRQFGVGSIYHWHLYAIIVGVFLPVPFWFWRRKYPNSWVKWVSTPVVLNGVSWIPPATGINYSSWFMVGFIFQYVVRKRNFAWWSKFNYVLSSALDSGTVIAVIVIFFTLQFPKGGVEVKWWGNQVHRNTADWRNLPLLPIPSGGIEV